MNIVHNSESSYNQSNNGKETYELSLIQRQFWLLQQLDQDNSTYNVVSLFQVEGKILAEILERSINAIVNKHEIFRTLFKNTAQGVLQVVLPQIHLKLEEVILTRISGLDQKDQWLEFIKPYYTKPFNLEEGPLLRCHLFTINENEHLLLIVAHHIIFDLRTKDLFAQELEENYKLLKNNDGISGDAAIQYSQYSEWHNAHITSSEISEMISFWKNELAGCEDYLNLPLDYKRNTIQTHNGSIELVDFPDTVSSALESFSAKSKHSIFNLLLAAYYILLHKYSRQNDITIGIPFPNRCKEEFQDIMGCFVNILPFRIDVSDTPTLTVILDRIQSAVERVSSNQEVPFAKIVETLAPQSDNSYNPLFQTGFSFEHPMNLTLEGLMVEPIYCHQGGAQLDLFVTFWKNSNGQLQGVFEYNTDLFSADTIRRMTHHFKTLLINCLNNPEASIHQLQMMDEAEAKKICLDWNLTDTLLPDVPSFVSLFEQVVSTQENAAAIIFKDRKISYKELNERANMTAHYLKKMGVGKESIIGVCVERSIEMVVAILGVLKSGAAYLPLDPGFPQKRLDYMLDHSSVKLIMTEEQFRSNFQQNQAHLILIDSDWPTISNNSIENLQNDLKLDNLAYVMYTSGSTGAPKGVQITHGAVLNFLISMKTQPGLTGQDILAAITTLSFDISVLEIFLPLITGAKIVLVDKQTAMDGPALSHLLNENNVTIMQATPTTWRILLAAGWSCRKDFTILCGGEALPDDLVRKLVSMSDNVWNMYGPTETTVWSTCYKFPHDYKKLVVGKPIANTQIFILSENLQPVPVGVPGELYIGGKGVSRGYLKNPELTKDRFIQNPLPYFNNETIYKTGDLCRYTDDGNVDYIGRIDFQVKVRGFRIELGEIESNIRTDPAVRDCIVTVSGDTEENKRLVGYVIEEEKGQFSSVNCKENLKKLLPGYMIPDIFISMDSFPLTPNNKLDRKALPKPDQHRPELAHQYIPARTDTEKLLERIWKTILKLDKVGIEDNFFELGGKSLLAMQMTQHLLKERNILLPIVKLFEFPTIAQLADYLDNKQSVPSFVQDVHERARKQTEKYNQHDSFAGKVAIIGMAGRFPGAETIDQLWENLSNNVESISFFEKSELGPGIDPDLLDDPNYVLARGIISDADKFDAAFFGINPNEAKVTDPQQRVFLELAWAALENAGYDAESYKGLIGVYAGVGDNYYYPINLLPNQDILKMVGSLAVEYGNIKDYIATRVSYCLNLTGPSVNINTACSTGLAVVDNAFKDLLNYECDMALAGAVDICTPQKHGFLHEENGTFCKDGHCRPFDSEASGTMFCDGAGIVVLKRLADAIEDRDTIYAVIRSTAKNNDGSNKVSFLAPSVEGQAKVIALAQAQANITPDQISYIEAHGTGTPIGDPIEIEALTKVFRIHTDKKQFCRIGSIKGHIGHPTNSAGVAGLIKAALSLYHEKIPATMHFKKPNPKIDFANSPFKVIDTLTEWKRDTQPRIAGISSFGFGGTNVHAIIEEAPLIEKSKPEKPYKLLLLSAKTEKTLNDLTERFHVHLDKTKETSLADTAFTLQTGRKYFGHRRFVVAKNKGEAVINLKELSPIHTQTRYCELRDPEIVFMFPGQGAQYVNMGRNLYESELTFKKAFDLCAEKLIPYLHQDLREIIFVDDDNDERSYNALKNTFYTQPAIYSIEYALAQLLMSWGVKPAAMIGHSIGEFVCATLSGMFSLDDALRLIALRGKLISELPKGSMLSVRRSAEEIEPLLPANIQLATSNSPQLCVVSGPDDAVRAFQQQLEKENIISKELHTSHAFHSAMMDSAVEPFISEVAKVEINVPKIPFLSTLNLKWVSEDNRTDAEYWGRHMRMPVRFAEAIKQLIQEKENTLFLEVGPRTTLSTLVRQQVTKPQLYPVTPSLSDNADNNNEWHALLSAVGYLWLNGVNIDWQGFYKDEKRNKIPLPTYPFEKTRYWLDPPAESRSYGAKAPTRYKEEFISVSAENVSEQAIPGHLHEEETDSRTINADIQVKDQINQTISEIFGQDISQAGQHTTFVEMGMDSLFLTQLAYKLKTDYHLPISFSQLMKEYPTVDLLADHILKHSPVPLLQKQSDSTGSVESSGVASIPVEPEKPEVRTQESPSTASLEDLLRNQNQKLERLITIFEKNNLNNENASQVLQLIKENTGTIQGETQDHIPAADKTHDRSDKPPVDGAKLGRDRLGDPHWFVTDNEGQHLQIEESDVAANKVSYVQVDYDPFKYGEVATVVEATEAQREMWLSCQMGPEASCAYNESISLTLRGSIDPNIFHHAFDAVIERHNALRSTFSSDGLSLLINASGRALIKEHDFSGLEEVQADEKLKKIISENGRLPFDLSFGPLIRFNIIKKPNNTSVIHFVAHHIICDGWSLDVILKDIADYYSQEVKGEPWTPSSVMQFSDYSKLQSNLQGSEEYRNAMQYWLDQFQTSVPNLDLPYDRLRPSERTYDGGYEYLTIKDSIRKRIQDLSKETGCSIFTIVLAGFYVLLHRLSGQNDIVVGIPAAGQPAIGQRELVGHCTNLLPLVNKIHGEEIFRTFLEKVQTSLLSGYEHHQCTYGTILKELKLPREKNRMPLVSVGFTNSSSYRKGELDFGGLSFDYSLNPRQFETFDLYMNIRDNHDSAELRCHYNSNIFDGNTILSHLNEFETVLDDITKDQDRLISEVEILPQSEKERLIHNFNKTQSTYPQEKLVHHLFEEQAQKTPEAVAVVFENTYLTYKELDERSNQLAHHLRKLGVGPEVFVGVFLERSLEMIIALYAIHKAGGAYVPLDPDFPQERLLYMLEDTQVNVLLTQKELEAQLHVDGLHKISLDTDWPQFSDEPVTRLSSEATPDNLAYVIYTSGSTGKPKGVQVPHRGVVNFLLSMGKEPGISANDVLLAVTTLSFDISVLELFLPLITGAKIIIASREIVTDGEKLRDIIAESNVSIMQATPTTWYLLLAADWKGSDNFKVLCGGEPMPHDLARKLLKCSSSVWNLYGPTETTIWSTCYQVVSTDSPILIGKPIDNTQTYIINQANQLNPIGVAGELLIGGDGVTRGYLNRPELTSKSFIPDIFSNDPNRMLYRTGDLACLLADGNLKIFGRIDHQVKLRGYRIELGEIETVLTSFVSIDKAVVLVREDEPGDRRLVAYFTLKDEQDYSQNELRNYMRGKLPEYMVPSFFVKLTEMPLTLNGKIDRKALPQPEQKRSDLEQEFVPPQNEIEKLLSEAWVKILKIDRVGVHDNFFELGGTSLLIVQLVGRLKKESAIDIPVVKFFQYPTIHACAAYIENRQSQQQPSANALKRAQLQRKAMVAQKLSKGKENQRRTIPAR